MSKTIKLATDHPISWPARCAMCGTKNDLVWASATSGRVTSVAPTLSGAVRVKSELLDLSYPVCQQHAKGLALANTVTRNTLGFKLLRGVTYFLGPLAILPLVMLPLRWFVPSATPRAGTPVALFAIMAIFVVALIVIVRSFRALPLRIEKQTEDTMSIKFRQDRYANEVVKLNRDGVISS